MKTSSYILSAALVLGSFATQAQKVMNHTNNPMHNINQHQKAMKEAGIEPNNRISENSNAMASTKHYKSSFGQLKQDEVLIGLVPTLPVEQESGMVASSHYKSNFAPTKRKKDEVLELKTEPREVVINKE